MKNKNCHAKVLISKKPKGVFWGAYILLVVILLMGGCAGKKNYVESTRKFSNDIVLQIEEDYRAHISKGNDDVKPQKTLTFMDMFLNAAENNEDVKLILSDIEKSQIDIEQASSYLWPRLNLEVDAKNPLTEEYDSDVTGGVFADFDIWKALAVKDEVVLRKVQVEKSIHQLKLTLQNVQMKIIEELLGISFFENKFAKKKQALELANKAYELAQVYGQQESVNVSALPTWQNRINTIETELIKIEQELILKENSISDLLGMDVGRKTVVKDWAQVSEKLDPAEDMDLTLSQIWERHSEAKLYELKLTAAEVALDLLSYERLPKINATLGLGSVPLSNETDTADAVLEINMSMPLFDQGDFRRKQSKSRIERDQVKQELASRIKRFWNRYQIARSNYLQAQKWLTRLGKSLDRPRDRIEKQKILIAQRKGNNLNLYLQQIAMIDLEILQIEALKNLKIAATKLCYASGNDSVPGSIEKIIKTLSEYSDFP